MKALSLWQPHASLVAAKIKWLETRSWRTEHRGPLAIHSSALYPRAARELAATPPFRWALSCLAKPLPLGCVLCIAELTAVHPVKELIGDDAQRELFGSPTNGDLATQFPFGDFSPGRFIWVLKNIRPIAPVAVRGGQRIWEWEDGDGRH